MGLGMPLGGRDSIATPPFFGASLPLAAWPPLSPPTPPTLKEKTTRSLLDSLLHFSRIKSALSLNHFGWKDHSSINTPVMRNAVLHMYHRSSPGTNRGDDEHYLA